MSCGVGEVAERLENELNILEVKVSPLQAMKAHVGCGCKGLYIHSHGTRKR